MKTMQMKLIDVKFADSNGQHSRYTVTQHGPRILHANRQSEERMPAGGRRHDVHHQASSMGLPARNRSVKKFWSECA
jgi:hypothetical protein